MFVCYPTHHKKEKTRTWPSNSTVQVIGFPKKVTKQNNKQIRQRNPKFYGTIIPPKWKTLSKNSTMNCNLWKQWQNEQRDYGKENNEPICSLEQNFYHDKSDDLFNMKLLIENPLRTYQEKGYTRDPFVFQYKNFVCMVQSTSHKSERRSRCYSSETRASISASSSECQLEEMEVCENNTPVYYNNHGEWTIGECADNFKCHH